MKYDSERKEVKARLRTRKEECELLIENCATEWNGKWSNGGMLCCKKV